MSFRIGSSHEILRLLFFKSLFLTIPGKEDYVQTLQRNKNGNEPLQYPDGIEDTEGHGKKCKEITAEDETHAKNQFVEEGKPTAASGDGFNIVDDQEHAAAFAPAFDIACPSCKKAGR